MKIKSKDKRKKYTEPKEGKEDLYDFLGKDLFWFMVACIVGFCVSYGLSGMGIFLRMKEYHLLARIPTSILLPVLVEGFTFVFGSLAVGSFFRMFTDHKNWKIYLLLTVLFSTVFYFMASTNIDLSTSSSIFVTKKVIGEAAKVDPSYKVSEGIKNTTLLTFNSDSVSVVTKVNSDKREEKERYESIISKASKQIDALVKSNWYNTREEARKKEIDSERKKIQKAKASIKLLNSKYKAILQDSISSKRVELFAGLAKSESEAMAADTLASSTNAAIKKAHETKTSNATGITSTLAILGVLSGFFWVFYNEMIRALCGVNPVPNDNTRRDNKSLTGRTYNAVKDIIFDFIEFDLISSLEGAKRSNMLLEEKYKAQIKAEKENAQIEAERLKVVAEQERQERIRKENEYNIRLAAAKAESERIEKEAEQKLALEIEKQRQETLRIQKELQSAKLEVLEKSKAQKNPKSTKLDDLAQKKPNNIGIGTKKPKHEHPEIKVLKSKIKKLQSKKSSYKSNLKSKDNPKGVSEAAYLRCVLESDELIKKYKKEISEIKEKIKLKVA